MTPFSSVAMLEKLALFRIAFCGARVLSSAASRRTSAMTSPVPASSSRTSESKAFADMAYLRAIVAMVSEGYHAAGVTRTAQKNQLTISVDHQALDGLRVPQPRPAKA